MAPQDFNRFNPRRRRQQLTDASRPGNGRFAGKPGNIGQQFEASTQTFKPAGPSREFRNYEHLSDKKVAALTTKLQQLRATNRSSKNPAEPPPDITKRINAIRGRLSGRRSTKVPLEPGKPPVDVGGPPGFPHEPPPYRGPTEAPPAGAPGPPVPLPGGKPPVAWPQRFRNQRRGRPLR